jgi:membrane-bound lytic murein transglycosylase B
MPATKKAPSKKSAPRRSTSKKAASGKSTSKKSASNKQTASQSKSHGSGNRKWSAGVTKHSNALDLDKGVFKKHNPTKIAHSLERSADESTHKKSNSYRSAMSMLTFYINRAGKNLSESQKKVLNKAKDILREDHEKTQGQPRKKNSHKTTR